MNLYHIVLPSYWQQYAESAAYVSPTFEKETFIHLSTATQVEATLNRYYTAENEIIILTIDDATLQDGLKYEPAPSGELFPHLYSELPLSAVKATTLFRKDGALWEVEL